MMKKPLIVLRVLLLVCISYFLIDFLIFHSYMVGPTENVEALVVEKKDGHDKGWCKLTYTYLVDKRKYTGTFTAEPSSCNKWQPFKSTIMIEYSLSSPKRSRRIKN